MSQLPPPSQYTTGSGAINLRALFAKPGTQVKLPPADQQKIGVDYLPPMTAKLDIRAPIRPESQVKSSRNEAGMLPDEFSWHNPADVSSLRYGNQLSQSAAAQLLTPVQNQYACGQCWACSSAGVFGDRLAIWSMRPNIPLSASNIIACKKTDISDGCNGGLPSDAGTLFEEKGIPSAECWPDTWCSSLLQCKSGGSVDLNPFVPNCDKLSGGCISCNVGNCAASTSPKLVVYKAKQGTTQAVLGIDAIKAEIWNCGPVVCCYRVYADFAAGTTAASSAMDGWKPTKGVYINRQRLPSPYTNYPKGSESRLLGGHAVAVVGWGIEKNIPGFGDVPYWIVRNSWGSDWNGDGYFKIAFTDAAQDINVNVGFDVPIKISGFPFGGATVFDPNMDRQPPSAFPSPSPLSAKLSFTSPGSSVTKNGSLWPRVAAFLVLFVLFIAFVLWIKRKTATYTSPYVSCGCENI